MRILPTVLMMTACAAALAATSAQAGDLQLKIRKVGGGSPGIGPAFVELQMYAPGQTDLAGHQLTGYASGPVLIDTYVFPAGVVLDGTDQRRIRISFGAEAGVGPDFTGGLSLTGNLAGAVCFDASDCVAWGSFAGAAALPSPAGTPALLFGDSSSLTRSIAAGCATLLEVGDDSDNSATDFAVTVRAPRNNASPIVETPCAPLIFADGFEGPP